MCQAPKGWSAANGYPELMGDSLGAPKLRRALLATVAAAPVALATLLFRGTASSPITVGRVLVHLAMLSTASGWMLPPNGEADAFSSHATMITGGVSGARDRRRLVGSSCDGSWCASPRPCLCFPCASLPRLLRNTAAAVLAAVIFVMAALAAATRAATPTAMTAVTVVAMVFSAVTVIIATTVATAPATATAMTAATPIVTVDVTASAIPAVPPALLASTAPRASHLWPARRGSAARHAPTPVHRAPASTPHIPAPQVTYWCATAMV